MVGVGLVRRQGAMVDGINNGCPNDSADPMCLGGDTIAATECTTARANARMIIQNLKATNHYFPEAFDIVNVDVPPP